MTVSAISPRMRRMQWIAVGLVTAAIALNYIDRSTLAVGNVKIREEFGISATAIGALQSAWSITYALCQVPIGYFLDRLGPRYLVGRRVDPVVGRAGRRAGSRSPTCSCCGRAWRSAPRSVRRFPRRCG